MVTLSLSTYGKFVRIQNMYAGVFDILIIGAVHTANSKENLNKYLGKNKQLIIFVRFFHLPRQKIEA